MRSRHAGRTPRFADVPVLPRVWPIRPTTTCANDTRVLQVPSQPVSTNVGALLSFSQTGQSNTHAPPSGPRPRGAAEKRGWAMASSLRDDLASLSIDRGRKRPAAAGDEVRRDPRGIGGDGGIRLLSVLIWLIPLGLAGGWPARLRYRQYDQIRAKPEVTVGAGPGDDHRRGREAAHRQGLPQVAASGPDRRQGPGPGRTDAGRGGVEGQEGGCPGRPRAQRAEGAPGVAQGHAAAQRGRAASRRGSTSSRRSARRPGPTGSTPSGCSRWRRRRRPSRSARWALRGSRRSRRRSS